MGQRQSERDAPTRLAKVSRIRGREGCSVLLDLHSVGQLRQPGIPRLGITKHIVSPCGTSSDARYANSAMASRKMLVIRWRDGSSHHENAMRPPGDKVLRTLRSKCVFFFFWPPPRGKMIQARKSRRNASNYDQEMGDVYVAHDIRSRGYNDAPFYHPRRQINADRACASDCGFAVRAPARSRHPAEVCGVQRQIVEKRIGKLEQSPPQNMRDSSLPKAS